LASLASEFGTVRTVLAAPSRDGADARIRAGDHATGRSFVIVSRRTDLPAWLCWNALSPTSARLAP
jgi:hypothetical protein